MEFLKVSFIILLISFFALTGSSAWYTEDKVLLKDIQVITLNKDEFTVGRRNSPRPQLKCIGGCSYVLKSVQCYNRGNDGINVQWECKAQMSNVKFGRIRVICEGYNSSDDSYVLKGSCGLEYSLESTGGGQTPKKHGSRYTYRNTSYSEEIKYSIAFVLGILILCLLGFAIYRCCCTSPLYTTAGGGNYYNTSGGGGGYYPAATPYAGYAPQPMMGYPGGYAGGMGMGGTGSALTGAMAGGALGYVLGSRNNDCHGNPGYYSSPSSYGFTGNQDNYNFSPDTVEVSGFGGTDVT